LPERLCKHVFQRLQGELLHFLRARPALNTFVLQYLPEDPEAVVLLGCLYFCRKLLDGVRGHASNDIELLLGEHRLKLTVAIF
jgi:hypothetical protein